MLEIRGFTIVFSLQPLAFSLDILWDGSDAGVTSESIMKKILLARVLLPMLAGCCLTAGAGPADPAAGTAAGAPAPWSRELAIVSLASYPLSKAEKAEIRTLGEFAKTLGLEPAWVDADIFLPEQRAQCRQYRRILIPRHAFCFTPVMYAGMTAYVNDGGLLISNSILYGIDHNGDRKFDGKDGDTPWPGKRSCFPTLGVFGHATASITNITVLVECPLSAGLPAGQVLDLGKILKTRDTLNKSAEVVITGSGAIRHGEIRGRPFLAYKHAGNGACVFAAPNLQDSHPWIRQIASNCFSRATLGWLTLQE